MEETIRKECGESGSKKKIKGLMKKTHVARRKWICTDKPHSTAVFMRYPPLKRTRIVSVCTFKPQV